MRLLSVLWQLILRVSNRMGLVLLHYYAFSHYYAVSQISVDGYLLKGMDKDYTFDVVYLDEDYTFDVATTKLVTYRVPSHYEMSNI